MKPTHSLGKVTQRRKYINEQDKQGRRIVGDVFALVWAARAARALGRAVDSAS